MTSYPHTPVSRGRPTRAIIAAVFTLGAVAAAPAAHAQAASTMTLYAAPTGSGTSCSSAAPCSLAQAKQSVESLDTNMTGAITVQLSGGTYRLSAPLTFGTADSGSNGFTVSWQAAAGQTPVVTGSQQVTGWTLQNSSANIYAAPIPSGADSRQLYIDGAPAPRAAITVPRSDFQVTAGGLTIENSSLDYLATLPEQNRIEVESQNSFTDRYAPVQSISGTTVTMQQPAWDNNNWGYDDIYNPFAGGTLLLENSYSFLQTGQWYIDPQAAEVYYKAPAGWNPASHDVELPRLTSLVQLSGSYSSPAHNLAFQGISFEGTTWLEPGTSVGYADQQNGTFLATAYTQPANFLTTCESGCQLFEATRNTWDEMPAAVQVSAADNVTFTGDTFTDLGEVGLGIGQDPDAVASGPGLGASSITVNRNTFTQDSGAGIVVGGVQPNAHHPSNPAMTDQNITITDNLVTKVAQDYKDMSGILSTYVSGAVIEHNQVSFLAYDGIDVGWGWGINDPGGSQDYVNRGTYNYQPVYTTPTTLKNTVVSYNLVHDTKEVFHDGGSIYNLSANPGAVIDDNYIYNNDSTVGLYLDEGSRYLTLTNNVIQGAGVWAFTNANANNNTDDSTFSSNWYNSGATEVATGSPHDNVLSGNVQVSGTSWPSGAQQVIAQAGVQPTTGGGFPSGYHQLVVADDNLCADVFGNTATAGAAIDQYTCNGQTNQQFQFIPTTGTYGELQAENSGQDIAVANNSTTAGTPDIVQQSPNAAPDSLWQPTQQTDGSWQFQNQNSGLCLDVYGGGSNTGQQLDQWPCKNTPGSNQDFFTR